MDEKESKMHQYLVDNLKDFILDKKIYDSKYSSLLKEITFDNVNATFIKNLNLLGKNIIENDEEEKKKFLI